MNWKYVKTLQTEDLINEFENNVGYKFPEDFVEIVKSYNNGRPENDIFDTAETKERNFSTLLSFNKDDIENIWDSVDWCKELDEYVIFAMDDFGNFIVYRKSDNKIYFVDSETLKVEFVADSFTELLEKLY
jgi:hypothetical protein